MTENNKFIGSDIAVIKTLPDLFERYKIDLKQNGYLKTKTFTNWIDSNKVISKSIETFFSNPKTKYPKIEFYYENNISDIMSMEEYLEKNFSSIKKWHNEFIKNKISWPSWLIAKNKQEYEKTLEQGKAIQIDDDLSINKIAKIFIQEELPEKMSHKEKMEFRKAQQKTKKNKAH